jgi:hypothetical protein
MQNPDMDGRIISNSSCKYINIKMAAIWSSCIANSFSVKTCLMDFVIFQWTSLLYQQSQNKFLVTVFWHTSVIYPINLSILVGYATAI